MKITRKVALATIFTTTLISASVAAEMAPHAKLQPFPAKDVRLLPGSDFSKALEANKTYLLALDPDRLLAPFRREAGLPAKAEIYVNWERTGLDGHTAGHYLSALSTMIAETRDPELSRRLKYMIGELAECQKASPDGYVGGIPGSAELWEKVRKGDVDAVRSRWVPWYNIHKLYAGLRDAWLITGDTQARDMLVKLADWSGELIKNLSDAQMEKMMNVEYGGMNEVLADVAQITGNSKYLDQAKRFSHRFILNPLVKNEDRLQNLHANTQVPKIIGFERIAALGGGEDYHRAADFFWQTVTQKRSVAFGGNSSSEHFRSFKDMLGNKEGPETCNTYNMLRLSRDLFLDQPAAKYADYYERALYNHILGSFDVHHPGYVYFTPIIPGHYRVYSKPGENFWCCVGTGMENPGRYSEFIYTREPKSGGLYVNLFIPSAVRWKERGLVLEQKNNFPEIPRTSLSLKLKQAASFPLFIRYPEWVAPGALQILINKQPHPVSGQPGSYVELRRLWKDGDTVEVELPMHVRVEPLPEADVADHVAILYGPIVLAASVGKEEQVGMIAGDGRMAHVAHGPVLPQSELPVITASPSGISNQLKPVPGEPLTFTLGTALFPEKWQNLKLIPFFRLHESRYMVYWKMTSPEAMAANRAKMKAEEEARAAIEAATLDRVAIGEQQSEVEHRMQAEGSKTGNHQGRNWRDGNRLSYQVQGQAGVRSSLAVTYFGADKRDFEIRVNGEPLAAVKLAGDKKEFIEQRYSIPEKMMNSATGGVLTVEFVAGGTVAGGIFGLSLVKDP